MGIVDIAHRGPSRLTSSPTGANLKFAIKDTAKSKFINQALGLIIFIMFMASEISIVWVMTKWKVMALLLKSGNNRTPGFAKIQLH